MARMLAEEVLPASGSMASTQAVLKPGPSEPTTTRSRVLVVVRINRTRARRCSLRRAEVDSVGRQYPLVAEVAGASTAAADGGLMLSGCLAAAISREPFARECRERTVTPTVVLLA